MKLSTIRIPSMNLKIASDFYEHSLGLSKSFGSPDEGFVGFELENALLLLEPEEPGEFECGRYMRFSVSVADIEIFFENCLKRGVIFSGVPEVQKWGGIMAHLQDCDGNTFSVVQHQV